MSTPLPLSRLAVRQLARLADRAAQARRRQRLQHGTLATVHVTLAECALLSALHEAGKARLAPIVALGLVADAESIPLDQARCLIVLAMQGADITGRLARALRTALPRMA